MRSAPWSDQETAMTTIAGIVSPTRFSDFSRRALGYTLALARWYRAARGDPDIRAAAASADLIVMGVGGRGSGASCTDPSLRRWCEKLRPRC
jgi:hypothetical protein